MMLLLRSDRIKLYHGWNKWIYKIIHAFDCLYLYPSTTQIKSMSIEWLAILKMKDHKINSFKKEPENGL